MPAAGAISTPTAASPDGDPEQHQVDPKISARPPSRNATMMSNTATHETDLHRYLQAARDALLWKPNDLSE